MLKFFRSNMLLFIEIIFLQLDLTSDLLLHLILCLLLLLMYFDVLTALVQDFSTCVVINLVLIEFMTSENRKTNEPYRLFVNLKHTQILNKHFNKFRLPITLEKIIKDR